ncbi:Retrotransposon-like protein 1 [Labeo rohita]|uniref:Retrotransposon-like protein 1 n=1 Tax=Labeo rohita TaxID=84645 RepID=A0ABQ8LG29_LABRO|nr:Retrotransposon-like protein 1 [Labeo rohita]
MPEAEDALLGLRQGGRRLERYVEDFLQLANQLSWNDAALGACFQLGLENETIHCDLPMCEYPLIELINLILYLTGSNFEVEEIGKSYKPCRPAPSGKRRVMPAHSSLGTPTYHLPSPKYPHVFQGSICVLSPEPPAAARSRTPAVAHAYIRQSPPRAQACRLLMPLSSLLLLRLRWLRPALLHLCWSHPALLHLRWSSPQEPTLVCSAAPECSTLFSPKKFFLGGGICMDCLLRHGLPDCELCHGSLICHGFPDCVLCRGSPSFLIRHGLPDCMLRHGSPSSLIRHGLLDCMLRRGSPSSLILHGLSDCVLRRGSPSFLICHEPPGRLFCWFRIFVPLYAPLYKSDAVPWLSSVLKVQSKSLKPSGREASRKTDESAIHDGIGEALSEQLGCACQARISRGMFVPQSQTLTHSDHAHKKWPPSDLRAVSIPPHVSVTHGSESCRLGWLRSSAASLQTLSRTNVLRISCEADTKLSSVCTALLLISKWESETCRTREKSLQGVWLDSPVIRAVMAFFSLSLPEGASDRRDERSRLKCVKEMCDGLSAVSLQQQMGS